MKPVPIKQRLGMQDPAETRAAAQLLRHMHKEIESTISGVGEGGGGHARPHPAVVGVFCWEKPPINNTVVLSRYGMQNLSKLCQSSPPIQVWIGK